MSIKTWLRRLNKGKGTPPGARVRRESTAHRATKVRGRHSPAPRDEQYDSEIITRYGDPFE
jgi:hypothetical protein